MMKENMDFFEQNDEKVNRRMTKILLWMTLVFPVLFGLTAAKIFWIDYGDLVRLTVIGSCCTIGPFVLYKKGAPVRIMKYVSVLAVGFIIMLLGMNSAVGIYITFGMAQLFSCMYFDKKFTIRISVITYILLFVSIYFRVIDAVENGNAAPNLTFLPFIMGFTIEHILMSCVFISVAGASREILESLHSTEQITAVMEKCGDISVSLVDMTEKLADDMAESERATQAIADSARDTLEDCDVNRKHVNSMQDTVNEMVEATFLIDTKTNEMIEISDDICSRMESYAEQMEHAVESMREIESAADMTEKSIGSLENVIAEITGFVGEIAHISARTNILAMNASIEASRAGEAGRGFSVVAGEIRTLAERSKASSGSIAKVVENVLQMLGEVKKSNEQNLNSVDNGIAQISGAREAARELLTFQSDSRDKTEQIAETGRQTGERSRRVREMAEETRELVENFCTRAKLIVEEADNQKNITAATVETFGSVKEIAGELLELSRPETLDRQAESY